MNGAQALIRTLAGCGVDVCFTNPGTSEMHFVAALDAVPEMRGVLCLFEGVATGAADGYGRMAGPARRGAAAPGARAWATGWPTCTTRAGRARRSLAVVGDHATYHKRFDAPLESDIDALAGRCRRWVAPLARAAPTWPRTPPTRWRRRWRPPGGVATLILPADVSWSEGAEPAPALAPRPPAPVPGEVIGSAAKALRSGEPCVILLGGDGPAPAGPGRGEPHRRGDRRRLLGRDVPGPASSAARASRRSTGWPTWPSSRRPSSRGTRHLILAGARSPVSFFAYPGQPSSLVPEGCQVHVLAEPTATTWPGRWRPLADLVAAGAAPALRAGRPGPGCRAAT